MRARLPQRPLLKCAGKVGREMSEPNEAVVAGVNTAIPAPDAASLKTFYSDMLLVRRFEERAGQLYGMGLIGGFCHLYIGQEAVVVGRSDIVGKPVAMLLLNQNATVTVCHSKTRDLPGVCRRADILVAAIGRAGMVTRDFVKPGATVIDVGINKVTGRADFDRFFSGNAKRLETFLAKGSTLVGDVHPEVAEVAGAITPVPGGVGPLTIAMLMANTVKAARLRRGSRVPEMRRK